MRKKQIVCGLYSVEQVQTDPVVPAGVKAELEKVISRETRIRERLARHGWRMMHRGKHEYWVMRDKPMTLKEIEEWL